MSHSRLQAHNAVYVLFEITLLSLLISAAQKHFPLQFLLLYGFSLGWSLALGKGRESGAQRFRWDGGEIWWHFRVMQKLC